MHAAIIQIPVCFEGWKTKARTHRAKGREQWDQVRDTLTQREAEVVVRRAAGLSHKHIANELQFSENNSKRILQNVMGRHYASNTAELISTLIGKGLLSRDLVASLSVAATVHLCNAYASGIDAAVALMCSLKPKQ